MINFLFLFLDKKFSEPAGCYYNILEMAEFEQNM